MVDSAEEIEAYERKRAALIAKEKELRHGTSPYLVVPFTVLSLQCSILPFERIFSNISLIKMMDRSRIPSTSFADGQEGLSDSPSHPQGRGKDSLAQK